MPLLKYSLMETDSLSQIVTATIASDFEYCFTMFSIYLSSLNPKPSNFNQTASKSLTSGFSNCRKS